MNIKVDDKVRVRAKDNVEGHLWDPTNSQKHLKHLKAEHLKDKLGIVISALGTIPDNEVFVDLDNGWRVIIEKVHLDNGSVTKKRV